MKDRYFALMERALSAYPEEHIRRYFADVQKNGLTEHGFPRLTANIGILIAHGRRKDLLPLFLEMMDFCCRTIPCVKAANDFSVREIVCCLEEVEGANAADPDRISSWKAALSSIEPTACYNQFARKPEDNVRNWALFTGVSEYFRLRAGLGGSMEFIDLQLASQLKFLDENGMYMDHGETIHQPIMYDLVPRGLFALLAYSGYRGKHYAAIDACLKKSGLLTLKMQSAAGEMAFGGRSNQFLHNEGWLVTVYEYEARRYAEEGNLALAAAFKEAIARAVSSVERWMEKEPIRHIKNRFPTETKYGCEEYAYFDKYMITAASNFYAAWRICDDAIPAAEIPDRTPTVFRTSEHFHKLFLKAGGYSAEYDYRADAHYDANGLGRVHREGAPPALCLSVPCPAHPVYTVDLPDRFALSLCPGVKQNGEWVFAAGEEAVHTVKDYSTDASSARAEVVCTFAEQTVTARYSVSADGVKIDAEGQDEIAFLLPAFSFDGEAYTEIRAGEHSLTVAYDGWLCRYTADGRVADLEKLAANRNGHYRAFAVTGRKALHLEIQFIRQ